MTFADRRTTKATDGTEITGWFTEDFPLPETRDPIMGLATGTRRCETSGMVDAQDTVVFRWLSAGDAGDLDAFDELLHPDVVVHAPLGLSTTNADAEKAVWKDARAAMPDLRHDVQEIVVDGDVEMARVVVTGTMTKGFAGVEGTGRKFRIDQAVITHLREGRVAEAWEIADIAALRQQVGEGEKPAP